MDANTMAIAVLLGSFFVMIFLRFPIAYAVGLASVLCLMAQGLPLSNICQYMVKGISSFSLMAVPFFITMGVLMGSGGISADCSGQCVCRLDAGWYGNGKYCGLLFLRRNIRFCICRYGFFGFYFDSHDGRSGV